MKFLIVLACLALVAACASRDPQPAGHRASVSNAQPLTQHPILVDVRTTDEYSAGHLPGAINIPVAEIGTRIAEVAPNKQTPLMVHCQGGGRSSRAKAALDKLGYTNVRDLGSYEHAKTETEKLRATQ